MEDARKFITHINDNYDTLRRKYIKFCKDNSLEYTDDIFQDSIIKCYDAIKRKGKLDDTTPYGMESYFFISLKMNIKREGMYARNQKRDMNYTSEKLATQYEAWYNSTNEDSRNKLISDLYKDFAVLYIMKRVELEFDSERFYLFRMKYLIPDMTYKKLQERTSAKKVRQKVVEVRKWVQCNITKEQIKEEFYGIYGGLL